MPIDVIKKEQPVPDMQEGLERIYRDYPGFSWQELCQRWERPGHRLYGAFFNGKWIAATLVDASSGQCQLDLLCVHDATRRRGVGRDLLDRVARQLADEGYGQLLADVTEFSECETFFSRSGFGSGEKPAVLVRSLG